MEEKIKQWSKDKITLLRSYAEPYAKIIKANKLKANYIDAFAGIGEFITDDEKIYPGSPKAILSVQPQFNRYFFIEKNRKKVEKLKVLERDRSNVQVLAGDCRKILLEVVFPEVRYEDYKRGLCFLDPYGMHLDWNVIEVAGKMKSIEVFLNFSTMDINRNILRHDPSTLKESSIERMNNFWGNGEWVNLIKRNESVVQVDMFGNDSEKVVYENIVTAYTNKLKSVAGFKYVSNPIPMRNSKGNIIYHLIHATHNGTGAKIVKAIFESYLKKRGSNG